MGWKTRYSNLAPQYKGKIGLDVFRPGKTSVEKATGVHAKHLANRAARAAANKRRGR